MWAPRSSRTPVLAAAFTLVAIACLLPGGYMLFAGLSAGAAQPSIFSALLLDARQRELLTNSALLGTGTALVACLIGVPLGFALARIPLPWKRGLRLALAAPVLLPPYVACLAWISVGGIRGPIAAVIGSDLLSDWTYTLPGAVIVLSLVFYPLSMLATEVALRGVDSRLEEAALLAAAPARVARRISLPLAAPAVLAAALVTFVLAVSEFGVPGLLHVRVFTTEVFTAFAALYDFGRASILTLPLLLLCLVIATAVGILAGERFLTTRRGTHTRPVLIETWRVRAFGGALLVVLAALFVPLAVLSQAALDVRSIREVFAGSRDAIINSLALGATGATAVVALAAWIGYARARARPGVGRIVDALLIVLFALPSTIVGVGLIGVWNRPGPLGAIYGTDLMVLLGYLARLVPVAALLLAAGVRHISISQEEAAAVGGAGWLRVMRCVVFPQLRLTVVAAWIVVFILAFGELGTTILVAPPGEATLPVRIYTLIANAPSSHVAALALLQVAVVFAPLAMLGLARSAREDW